MQVTYGTLNRRQKSFFCTDFSGAELKMDFFNNLLFSQRFIPQGHYYQWEPDWVWLHLVSDVLIGLVYYLIILMLVYFVYQRRDMPFKGILFLLSAFIITGGTIHWLTAWTLFSPNYWLLGLTKAITAAVSLVTVLKLGSLIPKGLALATPLQLATTNRERKKQIIQYKLAEETLQKSKEELEIGVGSRTTELKQANEQLKNEIAERKRTEESLRSLYKVSTARKLSFDQRLQGLLALGRRQFGLDMGALGRVERDRYEVIAAQVAPKSNFPLTKGNIWDLEQTYCRVTLTAKEPIAFESAGTSYWCNLPAYSTSRLEAYIGMPVIVGGAVYGTLSFFSLKVRNNPFTAGEKELLKLMAQWVGTEIERQQAQEELRQSEANFRELAQREALLNRLASQVRRSLDLNTILETAVQEIRNLLQIDRCFFLWYRPDTEQPVWEFVQEARSSAFPSLIGYRVTAQAFGPLTARVFDKEITRVDNARVLTDPVERKFFFSVGYTALLALPIHTTSGEIGVVSCGHSSGSRPWRDREVELLQAVADNLAIAIDQAQLLEQSRTATVTAQEQATQLEQTVRELQRTQAKLVQSEKMSSLGQLVAGVAHEINNPVSFIYGNLIHANQYTEDLLNLVQLYQEYYPHPAPEIKAEAEVIDLDFIQEDLPKILSSMKMGADRIRQIVLSLRNFSRLDEAEMKWVNIHEGLDNTLLILASRLKAKQPGCPDIKVIKEYGNLPEVQCYPGQLNQVFMNILTNAIEAIDDYNKERSLEELKNKPGIIQIRTEVNDANQVLIRIIDNGPGMTEEVYHRLFDPFFTTKPVGSGTGLGMSISYKIIVEKHGGQLQCFSAPGQGAEFLIYLPIC
jgi:signal transduction histidine kinase